MALPTKVRLHWSVWTSSGDSASQVCATSRSPSPLAALWQPSRRAERNLIVFAPPELRRFRQLDEENRRRKQIVADLSLGKAMQLG